MSAIGTSANTVSYQVSSNTLRIDILFSGSFFMWYYISTGF
jgi:hypothetical protein